ncbi:polysaccharide biosynthesis protein [Neobacillus notoginsengisoli]|uniref:Polysaccharide biosynthesis protein n=1 Tax=Neobacillus notoginsengisoli TaxID=1578198 RepID=A0A417YG60_9BACI|nr:polysaccharide biosynthesis protein [Neobacillus notoginsengisoli]RHW31810.1 polysaccharide biosynthesis protein [Neobacillus notoginsengisoli]
MEPVKQGKNLFKGAFILTAAALFTKLLSAGYRIPFQNIAGDIGFYIYQQVYPFYGVAMALATTGFPVVLSKLYAEEKKRGLQLLAASYLLLQLFGLLCFGILYAGSDFIARWMGDPGLAILMRTVSVIFLLFPAISVMRGYFQGKGDMIPTASSQIGEQSIRVVTILAIALLFTRQGFSLYYVGAGAMFGSVTGGIVSLIILLLFLRHRKQERRDWNPRDFFMPGFKEMKRIAGILGPQGLAICISSLLMVFIQLGDALNLYSLLVIKGIAAMEAKELKGVFDRGQPIIQLGLTAASTISLSLVPLIASIRLKKNKQFLIHKIRLAMRVTAVIGAGAAVGLWAIARPTNIMLFENGHGTDVLAILSGGILFSSIAMTASSILQGRGVLFPPAVAILAAFPLKYALNLILVPRYGTIGAAWATATTLLLVAVAVGLILRKNINGKVFDRPFLKKLLIAAVSMVIFLKLFLFGTEFLYELGSMRLASSVQAVSSCFFGAFLYLFIIVRGGVFKEDELALFPFGSKLAYFLPHDRSRKI